MKIAKAKGIEVLDSRGNPTIKAFVMLEDQTIASALVPSGASTGSHEVLELRDGETTRYHGKGVQKAISHIDTQISKIITGMDIEAPDLIDKKMIEIDESKEKKNLGANAMLAVSMAACRALALYQKRPLWKTLHDYYFLSTKPAFPRIMFNVINGGKHANWGFDIQEFIIIPTSSIPHESIQIGAEIYQSIKNELASRTLSILVGDEGGFSPALSSNEEAFALIIKSAKNCAYVNGENYQIGIDSAASEFFKNGKYVLKRDGKIISGEQLVDYYLNLHNLYDVFSYEDPFHEDDWEHFSSLTQRVKNKNLQVIGDDLFVTNTSRMKIGKEKDAANAIIIKPNQIGTIKETVDAINLAREFGWKVIVSHRSGETEDAFIADLSFACAGDFLKTGAPCRSDRTSKYNRLIEIENKL